MKKHYLWRQKLKTSCFSVLSDRVRVPGQVLAQHSHASRLLSLSRQFAISLCRKSETVGCRKVSLTGTLVFKLNAHHISATWQGVFFVFGTLHLGTVCSVLQTQLKINRALLRITHLPEHHTPAQCWTYQKRDRSQPREPPTKGRMIESFLNT